MWTFPKLQFRPCTGGQEAEKQKVILMLNMNVVYMMKIFILPILYQDYFHCLWNSNIWKIYNPYGWKNLELGYPKDRLSKIDLM